jgi:hypothetical protein
MAKDPITLGGEHIYVTIGPKNYWLLSNLFGDWWLALEDDSNNQTPAILIKAVIGPDGEIITDFGAK